MNEHESVPDQNDESTEPQLEGPEGFLDPTVEEYHQGLKQEISTVNQEVKDSAERVEVEQEYAFDAIRDLKALKEATIAVIGKEFDQRISEIITRHRALLSEANAKIDTSRELRNENREAE
ncbi:MAG: hypothetical protein Q7R48_04065 [bacterium]|nr:hypothetical protein [bacterium]